jgi:uncharacterized membrane protein
MGICKQCGKATTDDNSRLCSACSPTGGAAPTAPEPSADDADDFKLHDEEPAAPVTPPSAAIDLHTADDSVFKLVDDEPTSAAAVNLDDAAKRLATANSAAGAATNGAGATGSARPKNFDQAVKAAGDVAKEKYAEMKKIAREAPDHTADFTADDISKNKLVAILAYFGLLFLIPLFAAPQSKFAQFHANQGLLLFIVSVIVGIAGGILWLIPGLGLIANVLLLLAVFAFFLFGVYHTISGRAKELPFFGRYRLLPELAAAPPPES